MKASFWKSENCHRPTKSLNLNLQSVRICIWNFNGLGYSKAQRIKDTKDHILYKVLNGNDLICFSETWRDSCDDFPFGWDHNFVELHESGVRKSPLPAGHPKACHY